MDKKKHSLTRNISLLSLFDQQVLEDAKKMGGIRNGHMHLDRTDSLADENLSHIGTTPTEASSLPLSVKQNLVGDLHNGIHYHENLVAQMSFGLEKQIAFGVTRVDTNLDATPDLPEGGLRVINVGLQLKKKFKKRGLDLRIAPTPIFGFKDQKRWNVFVRASNLCDYLSLLPEKDDYAKGTDPDGRIGFKQHVHRGLELGFNLGKEVQFHVDQANLPGESGAERVLEVLEGFEQPNMPGGAPAVWFIHLISPSAYSEDRFARLVDRLLEQNVGIIVCPSAALSMRQLRSVEAPTHNSIARILELIKAKVPLRLGSDNVSDVFVPSSDGDMLTEIKIASNAVRLYQPSIWAKLACGITPNNVDIAAVGRVLYQDRQACQKVNPSWRPAFE